jgi:two-component system, NtrC family, sensor kinase
MWEILIPAKFSLIKCPAAVDLLPTGLFMPLRQMLQCSSSEFQTEMQLVLNALAEGVCGVDANGNATFCNEAMLRITGYAAEEIIGKNLHELMHHSQPDGSKYPESECPLYKARMSRETVHGMREFLWRKDGTCIPVEYHAHTLPRPAGLTACVITVQDTSERELAIAAMKTSEERFCQISRNIDQAFYLVDVTASRLVYASLAFETITGRSCEEVCQKPSPWRDYAVPEHRGRVVADYLRLLAGEETRSEYPIRHRDGSVRWIKDHAKPILDADGGVRMFVGVAEDITAIHVARENLRQSEERFRRILASVAEVAWTSDENWRTIYISPKVEAVLGYLKQEICAAGVSFRPNLIHPEDFGRVTGSYRALFTNQRPFDEEYRIRRKDGTWIWIHDRAMGVHEEDGILYADGVFSDITRRKQAEAELQWKTAFLEAQANSTIDGVVVVDSRGKRLLHNQKFVEMFRLPPELMANNNHRATIRYMQELVKDPAAFIANINHLNRHPEQTSRDEIEMQDGMVVDAYSAPVVDKDGKYYGRIWTFRDVTERRRAEHELRSSRQLLQSILDAIPQRVFWKDRNSDFLGCNRPFARDAGVNSPDEIVGKSDFDLSWKPVAELYRADDQLVMRQKSPKLNFTEQQTRPDGTVLWLQTNKLPLLDEDGSVTGVVGTYEDITERRRAERELWLTKTSLENASAGVFWIDRQGRIVYANQTACRSLGYSREELLSLSIPEIDPLFPLDAFAKLWDECKKGGALMLESQHKSKQGRIFPVEITASYIEFDGQEYSFAFVRDISERRELETQLRRAHKLEGIGQLAAGIAHEINTPTQFVSDNLTFLRDSWKSIQKLLDLYRGTIGNATGVLAPGTVANLEAAERDLDLDFIIDELPRAIEQSLDGAHRVAKIVRAMKEFSHPDSAEKTDTDLNRSIESTITVARNEWKYVAEMTTEFDATLPRVLCYPGDINQVILNLIVNAAHAIKEKSSIGQKGLITVVTRTREKFAEISVADTGTGIPEAIRSRIFDPFFTTKEVGQGTGQGLALAHTLIVKKHSGKIWFETEIGRGTTFFIHLPIKPAEQDK